MLLPETHRSPCHRAPCARQPERFPPPACMPQPQRSRNYSGFGSTNISFLNYCNKLSPCFFAITPFFIFKTPSPAPEICPPSSSLPLRVRRPPYARTTPAAHITRRPPYNLHDDRRTMGKRKNPFYKGPVYLLPLRCLGTERGVSEGAIAAYISTRLDRFSGNTSCKPRASSAPVRMNERCESRSVSV